MGVEARLLIGRTIRWRGMSAEMNVRDLAVVLEPDHFGRGRACCPALTGKSVLPVS
jgi:hypothetical protein